MNLTLVARLLAALGIAWAVSTAAADTPLSSTPTYRFQGRVNYVSTGATFRTLRNSATTSDACAVGTTATSAAVSGIPAGATIRRALLYWAASADRSGKTATATGTVINDTTVTFDGQTVNAGTTYTDIVPYQSGGSTVAYNGFFSNVADVTARIAALASPNKTYSMTGLTIQAADLGTQSATSPGLASTHCTYQVVLGGWGLFIIYEAPSETYKNMVIYEGFDRSQNELTTRTVTGLIVPTTNVAKTSILTWEGDENLNVNTTTNVAESLSFGAGQTPSPITNSFNLGGTGTAPKSGIFNGTVSTGPGGGGAATGLDNTYGVDVDTFDVTAKVTAGATSATLNIQGSQDLFWLSAVPLLITSGVADLSLTKTVSSPTATLGSTVTYTVTLANAGPDPLGSANVPSENVQVTDLLPAGLTFVSATPSAGTYTPATGVWSVPNPVAGASATLSLTATVTATGPITNVAQVTQSPLPDSDSTPGNNATTEDDYASVGLTGLAGVDLTVTKTASKASYAAGEDVVYTVTLGNVGPNAAGGSVLTDTLPPQLVAATWTCAASGGAVCPAPSGSGNLSQTVATLPGGGSVTYTIRALAQTAAASVVNTASAALPAGLGDPTPANNSASVTVAITNPPAATYTGPGALVGSTTCLDFTGMPALAVGGSWTKTVTNADGIALNYTVSVQGSAAAAPGAAATTEGLVAYTPGTWTGDRWQLYFGAGKVNALGIGAQGRDVQYTVSAYATLGTLAVPLQLLTGSAEEDGANPDPARPTEYVQSTTNGTPFSLVDVVTTGGPYRRVTVSGGGLTVRASTSSLDAAGAYTQVNIALFGTQKRATAADPLVLTSRMLGSGLTAQGFCAEFYPDRGDAPTSYGSAPHFSDVAYSPLLADGTFTLDQLTKGTRADTTPVWLGAARPNTETAPRGTNGTGDADDALASVPQLTNANAAYTLSLPCGNTSGAASTVAAWVDFNASGAFDPAERATAACPVGGGAATLTWSGLGILPLGTTYLRVRVSSDATRAGSPSGAAPDGEVEDYALTVVAGANLRVLKTGPAYARPGDPVTYTLTLTNLAGSAPASTTLTDTLPAGLTYVSSSPAAGVSGQTLTWTFATLAPGASQTVTVTATAPGAATLEGTPAARTLTNTATTSSALPDPDSANNSGQAVTTLVYPKLTKTVRNVTTGGAVGTSGGGRPGEVLEYCLNFSNFGGAPLPNFRLSDDVPGNTTAQTTGFDAEEPSAATGFGLKLTRGAVAYFTSAADADAGALGTSGGAYGRGVLTLDLGTLASGETGSACFRAAIR